jgi:nucleotide-binding universal stress UspA family protein
MYKVIMVPSEGSEIERAAIGVAVRIARRFEAEFRLVRVEPTPLAIESFFGSGDYSSPSEVVAESRLARLRGLEKLGAECRAGGDVRVITALEEGPVAPTLAEYASRFDVDLIVMPSHTRGGIRRLALGSVSDYLIRRAHVPVLVVKPVLDPIDSDPNRTFGRILVPLDGSELAEQILPHVADVASRLKATVNLLQVLTPASYSQEEIMQAGLPWWDADIARATGYLADVARALGAKGLSVSMDVVLSDNVGTAILDYCPRVNADLIAIATNGSGGLGRFVFGSVADEITRQSKTSLLVLRPAGVPAPSRHLEEQRGNRCASA